MTRCRWNRSDEFSEIEGGQHRLKSGWWLPFLPFRNQDIIRISWSSGFEGRLIKWNDDRRFGFITTKQSDSKIFVHILTFPKNEQRPYLDEMITFGIDIDKDGKKTGDSCLSKKRWKKTDLLIHKSQFARQISFIRCVTVASGTWCRWLCSVFALDEDQ